MKQLRFAWALALASFIQPVSAEVLKTTSVGCTNPADAQKVAALASHDRAGAIALGRQLVGTRACMDFVKGLKIDVDERRTPLVCIRLPGDLSCYWMSAALIDDHPDEKGSSGGAHHGGGHRH